MAENCGEKQWLSDPNSDKVWVEKPNLGILEVVMRNNFQNKAKKVMWKFAIVGARDLQLRISLPIAKL